jgi:hypothetical protein
MTDGMNSTNYKWDLIIYYIPPYFDRGKPFDQKVRLNDVLLYTLPSFKGTNNVPISVINQMPKFI